jgi:hypothetical protein
VQHSIDFQQASFDKRKACCKHSFATEDSPIQLQHQNEKECSAMHLFKDKEKKFLARVSNQKTQERVPANFA